MTDKMQEPTLNVGIMEGERICFSAEEQDYVVSYLGSDVNFWLNKQPFTLKDVTIGKQFHWEQKEDQTFNGSLHIISADGKLHAINVVGVEEYLKSVISSEMSANNNLELLKTHAIISRSWVLRQLELKKTSALADSCAEFVAPRFDGVSPKDVIVKWWDHDDHKLFDVCADDHCQRYQGITRQISPLVAQAVEETRGCVLLDNDGNICDARFSKCCGGKSETFDTCWQEQDFHYLQPVHDVFCNTNDEQVLRLVLNDYDQKTHDFYRWQVSYTQAEISELFEKRTGLGVGRILQLIPLKRGASDRIEYLKVVGTNRTVVIGKELMIRKALSETHLYSSAFEVLAQMPSSRTSSPQMPEGFTLKGKGWGHGVGLCQIGAACMSVKGFGYEEILAHYFFGAKIGKKY